MRGRAGIAVGRAGSSAKSGEIGPQVTTASQLRWRANGLDLLLDNVRALNRKRLVSMVEELQESAAGQKDAHLVIHLRTLALNPRLRWPVELYSSLLRWTTAPVHKNAALRARAIWMYLFGSPLPGWYRLDEKTGAYDLNLRAWKVWYDSLPHPSGGEQGG